MTSDDSLKCKECGRIFNTIEDLYEHEKSEKEDKVLRNKDIQAVKLVESPIDIIFFNFLIMRYY